MKNNGQSNSDHAASPQLTLGQLGGDALSSGDIVNLFRGNLSFPLEILSLPGRNGLNCKVNLLYQSNVQYGIDKWNLDNPSDTVGVGWSLPFEQIVLSAKNNGTSQDDDYYLLVQGQLQKLIAIPASWSLGRVSADAIQNLAKEDRGGGIQKEWLHFNRPLSKNTRLERQTDKTYLLYDDGLEKVYRLYPDDDYYEVVVHAQSFELEHFQYWQISYYKDYEQWEIVKNDGSIHSYGGNSSALENSTLQYGIKWDNWIGVTDQKNGTQYVCAWNLAKVTNIYGNYYDLKYFSVNQSVGDGSSTAFYTKECHVSQITNDFGWSLLYSYSPKIYDTSSLDAPKEYLDPHKDPSVKPETSPDAFQSRYSTYYLDKIEMRNAGQETLTSVRLNYYDLQNLTVRDERNLLAYGASYKRFLKSVDRFYLSGETKPGIQFSYDFTTDVSRNRGVLTQILRPSGGRDTINYREITVGADNDHDPGARNVTIFNPFGKDKEGQPRIWYGSDYVVSAWYSGEDSALKINVFTWMGTWYQSNDEWFDFDKASVDIDNLQIATSSNTFLFVIRYLDSKKQDVFLFNRRSLCKGHWDIQKENSSYKSYAYGATPLNISNGENFYIVNGIDSGNEKTIDRYAWNWSMQNWEVDTICDKDRLCPPSAGSSSREYYTTAHSNYYITLCHDQTQYPVSNQFNIYYLAPAMDDNGKLDWQLGSSFETDQVSVPHSGSFSFCNFSPSDSFAAIAYITRYIGSGENFTRFDYALQILTWDKYYGSLSFAEIKNNVSDNFKNIPTPVLRALGPQTVDNTVIGAGPNSYYYNGSEWQYKGIGIKYDGNFSDPSTQYYWFSYTSDSILKTENTDSGIYSELTYRNLNHPGEGWHTIVLVDQEAGSSSEFRRTQAYPSQAGSYLTIGTKVYNRSVYDTWSDPDDPSKIDSSYLLTDFSTLDEFKDLIIDTTTIINQAPYFIAFMTVDKNGTPNATYLSFLRNGDFLRNAEGAPVLEKLEGQQVSTLLNKQYRYQRSLNGKLPAIPFGLVTYSIEVDIDKSKDIVLHRYVDESMHNPVKAFVVDNVQVDSGYDTLKKCFAYTDVTAAQDATGTIVRFQTVTEYPGCGTPAEQKNGYTVSHFYNGLPPAHYENLKYRCSSESHQCYTMLDGILLSKEGYDTEGILICSTTSMYQVATQVSTDASGTSLRNLYGGIVQEYASSNMLDGITTTTEILYSPASGNPVQTQFGYYDSHGEFVTNQTLITYAYEKYDGMWRQNLLQPSAQILAQAKRSADSSYEILSVDIQTYSLWQIGPSSFWADNARYSAKAADAAPFSWWSSGEPDEDWLKTGAVLQRNSQGGIVESANADNVKNTAVYDDTELFLLAHASNASQDDNGISYDSFESYQKTDWRFSGSDAGIIDTDSFTGKSCYAVNTSGILSKTISLSDLDRFYIFGLWLKTAKDIDSTSVKLGLSGIKNSKDVFKNIPLTDGQWRYTQWVVNPQQEGLSGGNLQLSLETGIEKAKAFVRVDNIFWVPLDASFQADVYDKNLLLHEASIGPNGFCTRNFYDLFLNQIGQTGVYENTLGIETSFLTRQTSDMASGSDFPEGNPNFSISIGAQEKGFYDQFKADALLYYSFVNTTQEQWHVEDHQLVFTGSSTELLGAQVLRQDFQADSLAVYVTVGDDSANGISLGTGKIYVVWTGSEWLLVRDTGGALSILQKAKDIGFRKEWLFAVFDNRVLFFANGINVFNYQAADLGENNVLLGMQRPGRFDPLLVAEKISLTLSYKDGVGKELQRIAMESGSSVILDAALYDDLGRNAITILPSRITTDIVENPFCYYENYIANGSIGSSLWNGAAIRGEVNNYHEDTDGYPFSRQVFESAPTQRPVQIGQPGKDFAITEEGNSHITSVSYGKNQNDPGFYYALPEGQYFMSVTTDPDGNITIGYTDALQKIRQEKAGTNGGEASGQSIGSIEKSLTSDAEIKYSNIYNLKGQITASFSPACYEKGITRSGSGVLPREASSFSYDFLGRKTASSTPDTGTSRHMYDNLNRIRFSQDACGAAQGYLNYIKYDSLSRIVEKGSSVFDWSEKNSAALQKLADNEPDWPAAPDSWSNKFSYDGTDSTVNMVGNLWQSFACNTDRGERDVTETFAYNKLGDKTQYSLFVSDYSSESYCINYEYNPVGMLLSDMDLFVNLQVNRSYNPLGQLIKVTASVSGMDNTDLASYSYTQEGSPEQVEFLKLSGRSVEERQYAYLPTGWPTSIRDSNMAETLQYTEGSCDKKGYYTGAIAHQSLQYKEGRKQTDQYCFNVDYLNRVASANNSMTANSWVMDGNSNFKSHKINDATRTYSTNPDSNQLDSVRADDNSFSRNYEYGEAGDIKTVRGKEQVLAQFQYTRGNGLFKEIDLPENADHDTLAFLYGPGNSRILKTASLAGQTVSERLYVKGIADAPVIEIDTVGGKNQIKRYIHIPGTTVIYYDNKFYLALSDHLGSTRAIIDQENNLVGQYDYDVYGCPGILQAPVFLYDYLFTGQEYDRETELYNYKARLYDPSIGRFLMTDPQMQFFSPYIYAGNNPVLLIDPSGEFSWAAFGAGLLSATALVGGFALTVATGGAGAAAGFALMGAGFSGLVTAISEGDDFKWKDFGISVGAGAAAGLVGFGAGSAVSSIAIKAGTSLAVRLGASEGMQLAVSSVTEGIAVGGVGGAAGSATGQLVGNLAVGEPWSQGVGSAAGWGAIYGAGIGGTLGALSRGMGRIRQAYRRDLRNMNPNVRLNPRVDAQTYYQERIDIGRHYKGLTPRPWRDAIYRWNRSRYGNPDGPTFQSLVQRNMNRLGLQQPNNAVYQRIIASSRRTNKMINLISPVRNWPAVSTGVTYPMRKNWEF